MYIYIYSWYMYICICTCICMQYLNLYACQHFWINIVSKPDCSHMTHKCICTLKIYMHTYTYISIHICLLSCMRIHTPHVGLCKYRIVRERKCLQAPTCPELVVGLATPSFMQACVRDWHYVAYKHRYLRLQNNELKRLPPNAFTKNPLLK